MHFLRPKDGAGTEQNLSVEQNFEPEDQSTLACMYYRSEARGGVEVMGCEKGVAEDIKGGLVVTHSQPLGG